MFDMWVNVDGFIDGSIRYMAYIVSRGVMIIIGIYIGGISVMFGVIATKYANMISVPLI